MALPKDSHHEQRRAIILSFFGAVFVAVTLQSVWHWGEAALLLPFAGFVVLAVTAYRAGRGVERMPLSPMAGRVLMWSTIGEGLAILVGINVVIRLGHPDWVLPVIALSVGLHFLPIGWSMPQPALTILGSGLIVLALTGFLLPTPTNMIVTGLGGWLTEWAAAWSLIRTLKARAIQSVQEMG